MERNILIPISDLKRDFVFTEHENVFTSSKLQTFIKRFGLYKNVTVARVNNEWWILDSDEYLETLGWGSKASVACNSIGDLTRDEYLAARLFLTARSERLNYIDIAKAVTEHSTPDKLPNVTTLDRDDIDKYKQLLNFDWDAFLKAPVNPGQINLFENER